MRLTRIGDVAMRRITWFEEGLIPRGMLTGLVAPGGTVKGLYGIHLAASSPSAASATLFLCSEDALDYIVRPRFEAAGCDARLALALDIETETGGTRNLRFPSDLPVLREAMRAGPAGARDHRPVRLATSTRASTWARTTRCARRCTR